MYEQQQEVCKKKMERHFTVVICDKVDMVSWISKLGTH